MFVMFHVVPKKVIIIPAFLSEKLLWYIVLATHRTGSSGGLSPDMWHVACCRVAAAGNCCLFHPSPGVQTTQLMTASVSAAVVWLLNSECWPIIVVCLVQWSTVAGDNCPVMTGAGGRGRGTIVSSRRRGELGPSWICSQ